MTTATDSGDAAKAAASGHADEPVERALAAAATDPGRIGDVLTELSRARVWIPLPASSPDGTADAIGPIGADGAVQLPTVTFQGAEFVPVFTSAARMLYWADAQVAASNKQDAEHRAGRLPHLVVPAAALAQLMPARCGIAVNPDAGPSIAVSPDGVADLATTAIRR